MLNSVYVKNFKRFDAQSLPLNIPVLVLVGPNSAGKSSLLKALLAFKQTFEDPSDHSGFLARGEYVDIGPFVEYVHGHDSTKLAHFRFEVGLRSSWRARELGCDVAYLEIVHERDPATGHGRMLGFSVSLEEPLANVLEPTEEDCRRRFVAYNRMNRLEDSYKVNISEPAYDWMQARVPTSTTLTFASLQASCARGSVQAKRFGRAGMFSAPKGDSLTRAADFVRFTEAWIVNPVHQAFVTDLAENTFALAAIREPPRRTWWRTDERRRVGAAGSNTASVYANLRERAVKAGKKGSRNKASFARIGEWANDLRLAEELSTTSWGDLIDLRAKTGSESVGESLMDMGVGFSQAFPILVQLAAMQDGSRLLVEQPELHLYPRAQVEFGRLLCAEAKRANKRLIIETHSEHVIRGLQAHVSTARTHGGDQFLTHRDVMVLFYSRDGSVTHLRLNEFGEFIDQWPSGFFDQGIEVYREMNQNKLRPAIVRPEEPA